MIRIFDWAYQLVLWFSSCWEKYVWNLTFYKKSTASFIWPLISQPVSIRKFWAIGQINISIRPVDWATQIIFWFSGCWENYVGAFGFFSKINGYFHLTVNFSTSINQKILSNWPNQHLDTTCRLSNSDSLLV